MPKLLNTQAISQIKVIFLSQAVTFLSWVSAVFSQATGLPAPFRRHPSREPTAICGIHIKCTLCQGHYDCFLFRFLFYICLLCRGIKVMPLIDCFHLLL